MTQTEGRKFDQGKDRWSLMPWRELGEALAVLEYGARKYAPENWKKVPDAKQRYKDALLRHAIAYVRGERCDPESNCHHVAHVIVNGLFLLYFDNEEDQTK